MINNDKGFTLIELMVSVAILFIMALIAIPSWKALIQDNSLSASINQVQSIYQLARSEALKRRETVALISSNSRHTWTLNSAASDALKTITLSGDNISINAPGSTDEISINIKENGFAENQKIAFSWQNEYRCLIIYSSGQSKISTDTGDCSV
jgi:prepilin-type N-terminal cleavage/methylation domain-containing protein